MADNNVHEPMLDMFIYETNQQIEQLEHIILECEKSSEYSQSAINDIFRIMHTIKGSSAMMLFNNISELAHQIENLFHILREGKPQKVDYEQITDIVFDSVDFIKRQIESIENTGKATEDITELKERAAVILKDMETVTEVQVEPKAGNKVQKFYISQQKDIKLSEMKFYKAVIFFDEGCQMENIRAYTVVHNLKEFGEISGCIPEDIVGDDSSAAAIRDKGFTVFFKSDRPLENVKKLLEQTVFLKQLTLTEVEDIEQISSLENKEEIQNKVNEIKVPEHIESDKGNSNHSSNSTQSIISVNISKLDKLMDLVGELVIQEAMVTQNPDLKDLELDNFNKAARQLRKILNEVQDTVMAVRMLPLSGTFNKMNRIVRDMAKKLGKEVELQIIGEETEVDKNIIDHISDPLMHLIRNSIDHGIEGVAERKEKGKNHIGTVTLEAKNAGGDVLVIIKDDGRGLEKRKIYDKAFKHGLTNKAEGEISDKEIFSFIFLPGFSTNENVTEYSGRGVGMDVVRKNIETIGGSISVDSVINEGTTITLKIPLTLAIINGMTVGVGNSKYTIPTTSIKESFRPLKQDIIMDPDNNEMIMVRGECYPVIRFHELFNVRTKITNIHEGIVVMVQDDERSVCLFADELLGEQQVVVKALPNYFKKINGIAGCSILGDGSISLILDTSTLYEMI